MAGYLGTKAVFLSTTAASVTGNSTITGDLTVDTNTLYVDSTNNRVGIGTVSPSSGLTVSSQDILTTFSGADDVNSLILEGSNGSSEKYTFELQADGANTATKFLIGSAGGAATERMRIDSSGNLLVGKTSADSGVTAGVELLSDGRFYHTKSAANIGVLNRLSTDGAILRFAQDSTTEGSISVSGTTVSYNGGHLSRWSRLPDGVDDSNIFKGTVMTNLNEMIVWETEEVPATYWEEGDELPEGVSVGDIKTEVIPAGTEDNEQLNYTTVSSVEGDVNVAGIFVAWDESDEWGDYYLAQTGDLIIRIAAGVVVNRGDLLMSAGDGTAKPQEDDIVRSKTIAKVTSTEVTCTYADGSYCVPCVVMGC